MMDVRRDNRVLSLVSKAGLRNLLTTMLDQLQRCQKSLNEFLEVCFYFIRITYSLAQQRLFFVKKCFIFVFRRNDRCSPVSTSLETMTYWRSWDSPLIPM